MEGRILEFQAALAMEDEMSGRLIEKAGREKKKVLTAEKVWLPEKFPIVPEKMDFAEWAEDYDWGKGKLPLGYCLSTGELCGILLGGMPCFLISGAERTGRKNLLRVLTEGVLRLGKGAVVLDLGGHLRDQKGRDQLVYLENEKEIDIWQQNFGTDKEEMVSVFIVDMAKFCRYLYGAGVNRDERMAFWEQAAMGKEKITFMAGIYHPERDYETAGCGFFREFVLWQQGIHLGGNGASSRALSFDDLGYGEQNRREMPGIGYYKEGAGSGTRRLRLLKYGKEHGER